MKKNISFVLILCLCTSLLMLTACTNDSAKGTDEKNEAMSLLKQASEYYNKAENMKIDGQILSSMIFNDMFSGEPIICGTTVDVSTVLHNNPIRFSSTILSSYDDTVEDGGIGLIMDNNMEIKQYGVLEDDKVNVYQFVNDTWMSNSISNEEFVLSDTLGLNYIMNYDKFVTEGKIAGNETIDGVNAVKAQYKLNDEYLVVIFKKYGFEEFAKIVDSTNTDKAILDMMKDTTFTVWFKENSSEVIKIEVDLTHLKDVFKKIVIEDNKQHLSEERYAYLNESADKIVIKNTIYFSNINDDVEFELPEEAKNTEVSK